MKINVILKDADVKFLNQFLWLKLHNLCILEFVDYFDYDFHKILNDENFFFSIILKA